MFPHLEALFHQQGPNARSQLRIQASHKNALGVAVAFFVNVTPRCMTQRMRHFVIEAGPYVQDAVSRRFSLDGIRTMWRAIASRSRKFGSSRPRAERNRERGSSRRRGRILCRFPRAFQLAKFDTCQQGLFPVEFPAARSQCLAAPRAHLRGLPRSFTRSGTDSVRERAWPFNRPPLQFLDRAGSARRSEAPRSSRAMPCPKAGDHLPGYAGHSSALHDPRDGRRSCLRQIMPSGAPWTSTERRGA